MVHNEGFPAGTMVNNEGIPAGKMVCNEGFPAGTMVTISHSGLCARFRSLYL